MKIISKQNTNYSSNGYNKRNKQQNSTQQRTNLTFGKKRSSYKAGLNVITIAAIGIFLHSIAPACKLLTLPSKVKEKTEQTYNKTQQLNRELRALHQNADTVGNMSATLEQMNFTKRRDFEQFQKMAQKMGKKLLK